jgi:hypothetical protein
MRRRDVRRRHAGVLVASDAEIGDAGCDMETLTGKMRQW